MNAKLYKFINNLLSDSNDAGIVPKLVSVSWLFYEGSHQILQFTYKQSAINYF